MEGMSNGLMLPSPGGPGGRLGEGPGVRAGAPERLLLKHSQSDKGTRKGGRTDREPLTRGILWT
jgi:hypothetical protein